MNLGLYDSVIRWSSYSCMSVCVYVCVPIVCQSISFSSVFLLVKKKLIEVNEDQNFIQMLKI